jgi:hypothetical protein
VVGAVKQAWDIWKSVELPPGKRAEEQRQRFMRAIESALERHAGCFEGTPLDPVANRRKREELCERMEALGSRAEAGVVRGASLEEMVDQLRRALDANALRDRGAEGAAASRAALEEFRSARAAWARTGPVPGEAGKSLEDRFRRACERFEENRRGNA